MADRELTLFSAPIQTLYYFFSFLIEQSKKLVHGVITHPVVLYMLIPVGLIYAVINNLEGSHQVFVTGIIIFSSTSIFLSSLQLT